MGIFTKDIFVTCQASDNIHILDSNNSYLSTIKTAGDGPFGVCLDLYGNVIITNMYDNTVSIYNSSNNYSRIDIGVGNSPRGVVSDYEGNIWVACSSGNTMYPNGCVAKIDSKSRNVTYYETGYSPFGIAVDMKGNVWTTHPTKLETSDPWILTKLQKSNNYNAVILENLVNAEPTGIAVDADGNIWVACANSSSANGYADKIVATNEATNQYSKLSYTLEQSPYGVAVDRLGNVWVTNKASGTVSKIQISNGSITTYSCNTSPYGISIDKDNNVWICNRDTHKITRLLSSDYLDITQFDTGNYPIGFGDMTGVQLAYIVNHYKYLVIDNNKIKTWNGVTWETVRSGTIPQLTDFTVNGFPRLFDLNETTIGLLESSNFDVLLWSDKLGKQYQLKTYAIPPHKLILQQNDLSIETVSKFNDIKVTSNISGDTAKLRLIVSVDEGNTWHAYTGSEWITVDIIDLENVSLNGMPPALFNNIDDNTWKLLINNNTKLRFGYYFNIEKLTDLVELDQLQMDINIKGYWKPIDNNEAEYEFRSLTELRVYLKQDGNYKIHYTIMRQPNENEDSSTEEWQQLDVIAPEGTSSSTPYTVDLLIPYTLDFKRKEPYVLKFIPGEQNVVRTACNFNLDDNTKFTVFEDGAEVPGYLSKYVVWDGVMKFKTEYIVPMKDEGVLGDGRLYSMEMIKSLEGVPDEDKFIGFINSSTGVEYKFKDITTIEIV